MSDPQLVRLSALEARLSAAEARLAQLEAAWPTQPPPHPANTIRGGPLSYPPPPGWRPVIHKQPPGCGQNALYLTRTYHRTERANLEDMRVGSYLRKPVLGEQATCASCGETIDPFTTQDLDWTHALTDEPTVTVIPPPSDAPYEPPFGADPTGRVAAMQDAIHRAREAGIQL